MKKKIVVFAMLMVMTFFCLPADNPVSAQKGHNKAAKMVKVSNNNIWQPGKHNGVWRKKNSQGYKNYGQYRKTQVGNRRYRLVRKPYWSNGERMTRLVRIFY